VIGALSLYEEWGRASQVLLFTAIAMIFIKNLIAEWVLALVKRIGAPTRVEPIMPEAELPKVFVASKYWQSMDAAPMSEGVEFVRPAETKAARSSQSGFIERAAVFKHFDDCYSQRLTVERLKANGPTFRPRH
jgi:hypothetical protein